MKKFLFALLAAIIFISCRPLDERNSECIDNMPIEVRDYVRDFMYQSEKRGRKLNLKNLRVKFVDENIISSDGVSAEALYRPSEHTVFINKNSNVWIQNPRSTVFHELGHAILKRDHRDEVDSFGYPKSIMVKQCIDDYRMDDDEQYWFAELFDTTRD
jgi:Zn-dependent peptidase ImmA (M78 family)